MNRLKAIVAALYLVGLAGCYPQQECLSDEPAFKVYLVATTTGNYIIHTSANGVQVTKLER